MLCSQFHHLSKINSDTTRDVFGCRLESCVKLLLCYKPTFWVMWCGDTVSPLDQHHPLKHFFVCVRLECLVQVDGSGLNETWRGKKSFNAELAGGGWRCLVSLCSGEYLTGWKMEFHEPALPEFAWWDNSFSISKKDVNTPAVNVNLFLIHLESQGIIGLISTMSLAIFSPFVWFSKHYPIENGMFWVKIITAHKMTLSLTGKLRKRYFDQLYVFLLFETSHYPLTCLFISYTLLVTLTWHVTFNMSIVKHSSIAVVFHENSFLNFSWSPRRNVCAYLHINFLIMVGLNVEPYIFVLPRGF